MKVLEGIKQKLSEAIDLIDNETMPLREDKSPEGCAHYLDIENPSGDEFTTLCGLSRVKMLKDKMNYIATDYGKITCPVCLKICSGNEFQFVL